MSHKRKQATADRSAPSTFVADDLLPRRAFSVTGAPDYTDSAPQTAEEYLRRVKWEARNQPRVFTSAIDPRRFDHLQTAGYVRSIQPLPPTSARVMPSAEWESEFAAQFADIRLSFAHYSELHPPAAPQPQPPQADTADTLSADDTAAVARNCEAWSRYCLGLSSSDNPPPTPSLPTVAAFDQLTTRGVLAHMVTLMQQACTRAQTQQQRSSTTASLENGPSTSTLKASGAAAAQGSPNVGSDEDDVDEEGVEGEEEVVTRQQTTSRPSQPSDCATAVSSSPTDLLSVMSASTARWLYCVLAHLQRPLSSETEMQLRQLYRVCGNIRAEAGKQLDKSHSQQCDDGQQVNVGDGRSSAEETAMWCNMLLTIVDRIFGQRIPVQMNAA